MITEQPFLPLFFDPEDEKLWEQLQKLPPKKRQETVKQALYEFFQIHLDVQADQLMAFEQVPVEHAMNESCIPDAISVLCSNSETGSSREESNSVDSGELASDDEEDEDPLAQSITKNDLSLEALFEASPQATKPDPLHHLLSVIGEEDDEAVLKLLSAGPIKNPENRIKTEIKNFSAPSAINEVPLEKEAEGPDGGLAYLLQNVIGEEDDEEVLHFFQNIADKKKE